MNSYNVCLPTPKILIFRLSCYMTTRIYRNYPQNSKLQPCYNYITLTQASKRCKE